MVTNSDQLIRFLLPEAHCRGVVIRAERLFAEANRMHGLNGPVASLFDQSLLAAILLLSISKGGMRQVLQLDATVPAPLQRILVEARRGVVRGYLNWREDRTVLHQSPPRTPARMASATGWASRFGSPPCAIWASASLTSRP